MKNLYDPEEYDARVQPPPGDAGFYLSLAQEAHAAGHPVLELACGTGRVAIPIAKEGVRVVGLDRSPEMLARARAKSEGLDNIFLVEGDMENFDLEERFGLVFIPFRSFQHLLTIEDQLSCMRCVHRHLVPDGRFVVNIFNPDIIAIANWLTTKKGSLQHRPDSYTAPAGREAHGWETRVYSTSAQEVDSTIIDEEIDSGGVVVSRVYRNLRLRWLHRFEMEHLFARTGFTVEALYGDFAGSPFGDTSPEMVWVARRAG
jgi:SAM-dependent methyltransferase